MAFIKHSVLAIVAIVLLASCSKDDPLQNLPGTWTLTTVEVDGQTGTGLGTVTFNEDLSGTMAITFTGGGIQVTRGGSFTYEATKNEITFSGITSNEFTWFRNKDRSDEQEFEFSEDISGSIYTVTLGFTK